MTGDITTALSLGPTALSPAQTALSAQQTTFSAQSPTKVQGFTLIELMVVIVIAAILLTIAVPSFDNMIRRNTVESLQTSLGGALATARTEAAARNRVVTICASADGATCGGQWRNGWIVFEGTPDAMGTIIEVFEYDGAYTFTALDADDETPPSLSFNSQGFLREATPTLFTICDPRGNVDFARGMFVNNSGLVMKTARSENGGVHSNPLGGTLGCP